MAVATQPIEAGGPEADGPEADVIGALRRDLAAAYRLIHHYGMDDGIYTHISARLPGPEHHFLLNPFGLRFDEVTASNLVTIDRDGTLIDDPYGHGVNAAGFTIHSAVHMAREDVVCVLHTHTVAGVAVSSVAEGVLPLNQWSAQFHDRVAFHDYEGIALDLDERERLIADLGRRNVMILRNHGMLTCGRSVAEAVKLAINLERSCQAQVAALSMGLTPLRLSDAVAEHTAGQYQSFYDQAEAPDGKDPEWAALLRLMSARAPGFDQ